MIQDTLLLFLLILGLTWKKFYSYKALFYKKKDFTFPVT